MAGSPCRGHVYRPRLARPVRPCYTCVCPPRAFPPLTWPALCGPFLYGIVPASGTILFPDASGSCHSFVARDLDPSAMAGLFSTHLLTRDFSLRRCVLIPNSTSPSGGTGCGRAESASKLVGCLPQEERQPCIRERARAHRQVVLYEVHRHVLFGQRLKYGLQLGSA